MSEMIKIFNNVGVSKFVFIPNPGNAGDSLINAATFQFFDDNKLEYTVLSPRQIKKDIQKNIDVIKKYNLNGVTLILGGGGAFSSNYTYSRDLINAVHKSVSKLILLPCTVEGHQDLLNQLNENCYIFCREQVSFNYLADLNKKINVFLHDDMAFFVNLNVLLSLKSYPSSFEKKLKNIKSNLIVKKHIKKHGTKHLFALRLDPESNTNSIPSGNLDMSQLFSLGCAFKNDNLNTAKELAINLNKFDEITTDRLHIGILSTLLGKKVNFLSNSYFKNKAVFENSLTKFDNIKFSQNTDLKLPYDAINQSLAR